MPTAMPIDNATRMLLWNAPQNLDSDWSGGVDGLDAAANPLSAALLELIGRQSAGLDDVRAFVARFDLPTKGQRTPDGYIDQFEYALLENQLHDQMEHMHPQYSTSVGNCARSLFARADRSRGGNRDGSITRADRNPLSAQMLALTRRDRLDRRAVLELVAAYDTFDAARKASGSDGRLGPREVAALNQALLGSHLRVRGLT